jgi:hypothetical protein
MPAPSWLILVWSGCAATCAAAVAGSLFGGRTPRSWSLQPRPRSGTGTLAATIAAGVLIYPLIYGVIFEVLGRADVPVGAVMGGIHAVLAILAARATSRPMDMFRLAVMHLTYATFLALLYVTP